MRVAHSSSTPLIQINMAPPNKTQLAQKEGRIALAVQAYKANRFLSKRACANAYDILESTLRRRVKGIKARCDSVPVNRKLTTSEESALIQWILSMDKRSLSSRRDTVEQMANLLLEKRSTLNQGKPLTVGQHWVYNFVQRHTALTSKYNRKYDYQRAKCEDPALIRPWFELVRNTIAKYGIMEEDIYNFDETGF